MLLKQSSVHFSPLRNYLLLGNIITEKTATRYILLLNNNQKRRKKDRNQEDKMKYVIEIELRHFDNAQRQP